MSETTNLALPLIAAAQAQKHVTHNEALLALDALVQLAVLDADLTAPPGSPAEGDRYIVAASPSGAWSGHAGHIAAWQDGAWSFHVPKAGWLAYVVDDEALVVFDGSDWVAVTTGGGPIDELQNLSLLGIGTTADATNPFAAKLNNALWVAKNVAEGGDGDLRYKMSKESAAKTLSLLMQTNFSGRAELGLTGDDDFRIKVSADGTAWKDALQVDRTTGSVDFPSNAMFRAGLSGHLSLSLTTVTKLPLSVEAFDVGGSFDSTTNYRWTPPAGRYLIMLAVLFVGGTTDGGEYDVILRKNGVNLSAGQYFSPGASLPANPVTFTPVDMNGTDYIEGFVWAGAGTSIQAYGTAQTFMAGFRL